MSKPTLTPLGEARVWMGKLSRGDFEKLLLLSREARRGGAREAIAKIQTKVRVLSGRAMPLPGLKEYPEELIEEYPI